MEPARLTVEELGAWYRGRWAQVQAGRVLWLYRIERGDTARAVGRIQLEGGQVRFSRALPDGTSAGHALEASGFDRARFDEHADGFMRAVALDYRRSRVLASQEVGPDSLEEDELLADLADVWF